jgi:CheY-like chemotaxis protein
MNCSKVLLIEDDEDDQLIFNDVISEMQGAPECIMAANGLEAITLLNTMQPLPCIIFLDLNMPYISGFECLEKIKRNDMLAKIPVVIFTTSDSPFDKQKAKDLKADYYLTKTSDLTLLRSMLQDVFKERLG